MPLDLLIKNGTVVDGSGGPRYSADVGVKDGLIVDIGRISTLAETVINADGHIVSPGFIDGHTHMDAQVNWDPMGTCSCWHGVTTVLMGNCGFALAPCPPSKREWFARCLEAVEDIPVDAMLAGIEWDWETFPQYLDKVDRLKKGINYGAYIGHSALRMYTMGERALDQLATEEDLLSMELTVAEAMAAGAIGFSTSVASTHIRPDGEPVASRIGNWEEIEQIVNRLGSLNKGIFQIGPNIESGEAHRACLERIGKIALSSGRTTMFGTLSTRQGVDPNSWENQMKFVDETVARGARVYGQTTTRPIIALFSFKSYMPFDQLPSWKSFRSESLERQRSMLEDPSFRRVLVKEEEMMEEKGTEFQGGGAATTDPRKPEYDKLYALKGVDLNDPTVAQLSREFRKHPVDVMIDLSLESNFNQLFVQPLVNENQDHVHGMLKHPRNLATFSDSGAHVCQEMGSSLQTHMLSYWVRNKRAFSLEEAVRMLTFDNASAWEFHDRGLVRQGYNADLVVFDEETVKPVLPTVETDLPGNSKRLIQKAVGIAATIVNGEIVLRDGEATGNYPGSLIRGANSTHRL